MFNNVQTLYDFCKFLSNRFDQNILNGVIRDRIKNIEPFSRKPKLQHLLIRHLLSFEVVVFWRHAFYPSAFPMMEAILELFFFF